MNKWPPGLAQVLVCKRTKLFPLEKKDMPSSFEPFWSIKDQLFSVDGVILRNDEVVLPYSLHESVVNSGSHVKTRIIIPPILRDEVLQSLHAAHQGVSAMNGRARAGVFWPDITKDIENMRMSP